ncbi:MAG: helix-turn-helix domain-containing protein [Solirubrobacterales bacterium]
MAASASTRTVDRALQLLACVTEHPEGSSLSELARRAQLSPTTASRLLATLAQHGFVRRDDRGAYRPGAASSRSRPASCAASRSTSWPAPPGRAGGRHRRDREPRHPDRCAAGAGALPPAGRQPRLVQTASWTGRTIPMEGTAMGAALRGEVGLDGYASTAASVEPDVTAVAAPVAGLSGEVVAALSVIAPTYRTSDADVERIGRLLVEHARGLSAELGGHPTEAAA